MNRNVTTPAGSSTLAPTGKFENPFLTADGQERATVELSRLETLWFNTGTLCNLECAGCYIESSPRNDRLVYLSADDVRTYLDEIHDLSLPVREIGFTGGEPFMNPEIDTMLADCLGHGLDALVLTNGMRPMRKLDDKLLALKDRYGPQLTIRVSLDHFDCTKHEELRGDKSWEPALSGLIWLSRNGFQVHVAGRTTWGDTDQALRAGFARLFAAHGIVIDAQDPTELVLFPEMDENDQVPEITTACWGTLGVRPESVMCATSRMVVKPKGAAGPVIQACTLLPYDQRFSLGSTLAEADHPVALNHPYCAKFCVLGGGSCSA